MVINDNCVQFDFFQLSCSSPLCPLSGLCTSTYDICLKLSTICTSLRLSVCVPWAVIWLFNCIFMCVLLWGFVDALQHMVLLWAGAWKYVKRKCIHFHHWGGKYECVRFACIYVHKTRIPEYVHVSACWPVRLSEWALSGAAPCCASCIWSHLCCGSMAAERMTLMYLNPRQTLPRHSSV